MLSESDKALAIALTRAHVLNDLSYMSWVPSYHKVTFHQDGYVADFVEGHWRRKANCKKTIDSLACVCKQIDLSTPAPYFPHTGRKRNR